MADNSLSSAHLPNSHYTPPVYDADRHPIIHRPANFATDYSTPQSVEDPDDSYFDNPFRDCGPRPLDLGAPVHPSIRQIAERDDHPIRYTFTQAFGELCYDESSPYDESDVISAVRFNDNGEMLAVGDKSGRVVIMKRTQPGYQRDRYYRTAYGPSRQRTSKHTSPDLPSDDYIENDRTEFSDDDFYIPRYPEYEFWTQLQSHTTDFDSLKSLEIDEKINHLRWCRSATGTQSFLACNDRTVKLWRLHESNFKPILTMHPSTVPPRHLHATNNAQRLPSTPRPIPHSPQSLHSAALGSSTTPRRFPHDTSSLKIPRMVRDQRTVSAIQKRAYRCPDSGHINSVSINSDGETFLTSDDLHINMWNLHRNGTGFNFFSLRPGTVQELSEVITVSEFHPNHCHIFGHASSRGIIRLGDMRVGSTCETSSMRFEEKNAEQDESSFFTDIVSATSDFRFSPDGQFMLTREFLNLRLWDVRVESDPVLVIPVQEHLRSRFSDLYGSNCIFDKFQCCFSGDGASLLTGGYNSLLQTYSAHDGQAAVVQASLEVVTGFARKNQYWVDGRSSNSTEDASVEEIADPTKKTRFLDTSPEGNMAAVAAGPALYLYYGADR